MRAMPPTRPCARWPRFANRARDGPLIDRFASFESRPSADPLTREKNPLARPLWFANFLLRTFVLAKLLPRLFSPAAIVLVQRPQLSYDAVWKMACKTTRRLQTIAAFGLAVLGAVIWRAIRVAA